MLVLFSDVHLTDGTSGETTSPEAFDLFADQVAELARKRQATEVRLVLLGDGLDLLRSSRWLDNPGGPQPWSPPGRGQESLAFEIAEAILNHNGPALDHLCDMPRRVAMRTGLARHDVTLDYVLGNHDWLINRYISLRRLIVKRLDLHPKYVVQGFPLAYESPPQGYDVLARHGDLFDTLNYDAAGGRDASSVGDAIVIGLLNRFPQEVGRQLQDHPACREVVRRLKEIDNVRPYASISSWVSETVRQLGQADAGFTRAARTAASCCAAEFLANPQLRKLAARHLPWAHWHYLRIVLGRLRRNEIGVLDSWTRTAERAWKMWRLLRNQPASEYAEHAAAERATDGRLPRFVVYGHTHQVETVPLGGAEDGGERFYINAGTWRTVWEKAETDRASRHFAAWKVMSYVVLYNPGEGAGRHEFELWHGNLRDGGRRVEGFMSGARPAAPPAQVTPSDLETANDTSLSARS